MTSTSTAALTLIETLPTPALDAPKDKPKPQKIRLHPPLPSGEPLSDPRRLASI